MRIATALTTLAAAAITCTAALANAAGSHHVVYEVWGDASTADVLWFSGDNDLTDSTTRTLPFRTALENDSTYPMYGVTAQTNGKGAIACRVTVDGVVRDSESAKGKFAVVTCAA